MNTISYAITVCNEAIELNRLLKTITTLHYTNNDEIVILSDKDNVTPEVEDIIFNYKNLNKYNISYTSYPLKGNFSAFKNRLIKQCSKDFIFQIDADEDLGPSLIFIRDVIKLNPEIDAYLLYRINTVAGITPSYIESSNWTVSPETYNGENIINWPDFQMRLFRNNKGIKWVGKVHEKISGFKKYSVLGEPEYMDIDQNRKFALIHEKTFEKQIKQNLYYASL